MGIEQFVQSIYSAALPPLNSCEELAGDAILKAKGKWDNYNVNFNRINEAWDAFLRDGPQECRTVEMSARFSRAMTSLTIEKMRTESRGFFLSLYFFGGAGDFCIGLSGFSQSSVRLLGGFGSLALLAVLGGATYIENESYYHALERKVGASHVVPE